MLDREKASSPAKARLNLVGDEQDSISISDLTQTLEKGERRDVESSLSLNGFDKNGCYALRIDSAAKDLFQCIDGLLNAGARVHRKRQVINVPRDKVRSRPCRA